MLSAAHLHAVGAQQEELCSVLARLNPTNPGEVSAVVKFRSNELRNGHDLHAMVRLWQKRFAKAVTLLLVG